MNIYITTPHHRPFLVGTTNIGIAAARALGLDVDLFIHPGGDKEWAICLGRRDNPSLLMDWKPAFGDAQPALSNQ